jgi:Sin3 histone deacetylase corepressor complex component SDS3
MENNRGTSENPGSSDDDDAQLVLDDHDEGGGEAHHKEKMEDAEDTMDVDNSEHKDEDSSISDNANIKEIDLEHKRRLECLGNMEKIEKEFADLKEKFFKDKIVQLKREIESIKNGTHPQFCEKCRELEEVKTDRILAAEQWKQYQLQNINNMFEAERKQAEEEYKSEKRQLRERMINAIVDKKKKLTEEKMTMNLTDSTDARMNTRTLRKRGVDKTQQNNFKRKLNPPHINYTLRESEIMEDLNLILNTTVKTSRR